MINFFRKIRLNLLEQNKTSRYFKYALGEIFLVVIGILIALQISDWNELRKSRKFEKEILLLVDQNLKNDSILIAKELFKANNAVELTDSLLAQVSRKNYGGNLNAWMGKIISFERFKSQSSAFEVLKSKGIETITNKELQLALISYYDNILHRLYESLFDVEHSFKDDWIPLVKDDFSDFEWMDHCDPNDPEDFFEKPSSVVLFKIYQDNRLGSVTTLEKSLDAIADIRMRIKKHIGD